MCFSANASFGAGVLLSTVGIISVKKTQHTPSVYFGLIPMIFAFQQFIEGGIWLLLPEPGNENTLKILTFAFLFIAQVIWPTWVPLAIMKTGPAENRRTSEYLLLSAGGVVSAYLAYCLFNFPVKAEIIGYHISYKQDYPIVTSTYCGILYVAATILPPFFSRIRYMWLLGTTILISYIITQFMYEDYIVSVWCFFASIISIAVLAIISEKQKTGIDTYSTIK